MFLYASLDPKRKTSSCNEMRRLAYLDSIIFVMMHWPKEKEDGLG